MQKSQILVVRKSRTYTYVFVTKVGTLHVYVVVTYLKIILKFKTLSVGT